MSAASHPHRKRRVDVNGHLRSTRRRCLHLQCAQCHCPIRPFILRFAFAALHRGRLPPPLPPPPPPPPPPKAKSEELVMGSFISRLWPRNDSLQEYKRRVEASLDGGDLTVVTKEEAEEARVVSRKVGDARKAALEAASHPFYKEEHVRTTRNDPKLARIALEVRLLEDTHAQQRKLRKPEVPAKRPEDLSELFVPLTDEEQEEVKGHLYGRGRSSKILVTHDSSNIEISKEKLQCLRRGGWLNDEVINLYLELLKEREEREPKRFLKCHFFNTFFYKKLASGKAGYDYKSVRRWTTLKKLGYGLIECDKIFIPVHKDIHWCLAIINMKEKTFQYLDSLGGMDRAVLRVLARYITEEVKDKSNKDIDTSSWQEESVDSIPLQQNGWDCGMFMLKYIDFHCRGLKLSFSQVSASDRCSEFYCTRWTLMDDPHGHSTDGGLLPVWRCLSHFANHISRESCTMLQ